jgi:2-dehydro-3-deoxyphosphooctonate aldolase (KDO 8-P synthase)
MSDQKDRMLLLAGPCVIEDEGMVLEVAAELKRQLQGLPVDFYFKASFDKANRTAIDGFRGPGLKEGLAILQKAKSKVGIAIVTDLHETHQAEPVAEVADFLQIPAFLCRQTDLLIEAARAALRHQRRLNVKKGQFLAPWDAKNIVQKIRAVEKLEGKSLPPKGLWITERGSSFGYNSLVVDMTSFQTIRSFGVPVLFDATHSVQSPGAGPGGKSTGGKRENIEVLSRAAIAAGAEGLFMECHPRPELAKSDGPNAFYLEHVGEFVRQMLALREVATSLPKLLPEARALESGRS